MYDGVGLRPAVRQEFRLRLFSFSFASQSLEFNNNVVSFTLCSTVREWTMKLTLSVSSFISRNIPIGK